MCKRFSELKRGNRRTGMEINKKLLDEMIVYSEGNLLGPTGLIN